MKPRAILVGLVLIALAGLGWGLFQRSQPAQVTFATAMRETISSVVSTNGRVDPSEYATARAEAPGAIETIHAELRQRVTQGAPLITLDTASARASMDEANARIAQIQAEIAQLRAGGPEAEQAALDAEIANARVRLEQAQRELASAQSALAKQVETQRTVDLARDEVQRIERQIESLQQRKRSLVGMGDIRAAEARLEQARAALSQAQLQIERSVVRAPIAGTIYEFPLKPGGYVNPGDLVASIGDLDPVHVAVYVDEPDLGRVKAGQPVEITWDAMPGRAWMGTVEKMPARIQELETRQVGEVLTVVANPDGHLIPGTNVTAVIESETVENAVTIPKEALLQRDGESGVYVLVSDHIEWRAVKQGINNVNRTQVTGIEEGALVALPYDRELTDGMVVAPLTQ